MTHNGFALLIVDDEADNRDFLARRLSREGYIVGTAADGTQALELMGAERYDLVLLDLRMPELDGYGVLEAMKQSEALHDTPVIVLSAVQERDSVLQCAQLGAEDYLVKPLNLPTVKCRIWRCLERRRLNNRTAGSASASIQGTRVLVVDDNELNRDLMLKRVGQLGCQVDTAADGREALACLQRESYDLVLLDLIMPGLDGYDVLTRIKQQPALAQLPVVVVSAIDQNDSVARCLEQGAADYLTKPFNAAELQRRVSDCIQLKRLSAQESQQRARLDGMRAEITGAGKSAPGPP